MSHPFSPKSLLFYGTMIGSVVILFRIVSGYGEAHLTAPPNIGGYYLSEQPLPGCPESTRFALIIQQSGIYLHGALRLVESSEDATPQPASALTQADLSLGGLWEQQLSLTGSAFLPATCSVVNTIAAEAGSEQPLRQIPITIQGQVTDAEPAQFTGKVMLAASNPLEFTAIRAPSATQSDSSH